MPGKGKPLTKDDPRINRKGRPKKGQAIADAFRELLKEDTSVTRRKKGKPVEERINRLRLFAETIFQRAITGNDAAARLIANYVDGLPPFTGRLGTLPDEEAEEIDPEDEEAICEHLRSLIMGKGRNGNGDGPPGHA